MAFNENSRVKIPAILHLISFSPGSMTIILDRKAEKKARIFTCPSFLTS